jgi:selenocysteine lyase/cysteine desulfurase
VERIAATCARLTDAVADQAEDLGLRAVPQAARSPHQMGLTLPQGSAPEQASERLRAASVHVRVRGTSIRVSPHVYNDLDDVARFAAALRRLPPRSR